ncbi:MAG TPA: NADH-quinone oxidoreductase subunit N [Acetobacteraceae bacterium]|nr:NADH-quinone oxidoreductase subunit N [Acetobacteraceae bacterium]
MDIWAVVPEMMLAGLTVALVPLAGLARGRWRRAPMLAALVGLAATMVVTGLMLRLTPQAAFCGTWAVDRFATAYKLLIEFGAFITILVLASHFDGHAQMPHAPVLALFATVGGMGLVASLDLGLIVLFLQMLSMPSYLLAGLVRGDPRGREAAMKYFLYAAAALAVMAYGLTFLFGLTGSLELRAIGRGLGSADKVWIVVAFGLVLVGYAFEITAVPFHFWAPDVYEGGTAPAIGFISVIPKMAAFGGLLRMLLEAFPRAEAAWPLVAALAVASMTLGNLAALRQDRLKRLLAYSSIAQAGYVLMAVAVAERADGALAAIGFYLLAFLLMNLGAFLVIAQVERTFGTDAFEAIRGLARRSPIPAAAMALALLSLAGIPPLAGFAGKVFLLTATIDGGMTWLAVIGAANMAVGLFYYVRIIAEMYFEAPSRREPVTGGLGYALGLVLSAAGTLVFGIIPNVALALGALGRLL